MNAAVLAAPRAALTTYRFEFMSSGRLRQLLTLAVVGLLVGVTIVVLGLAEAHPLIQTAGWLILVGVLAFLLALVIVLLRRALAHLEALNGSHGPVRKDLARVRTLLGSAPGSLQARLRHDVLRDALAQIDPDALAPREALDALYALKHLLADEA